MPAARQIGRAIAEAGVPVAVQDGGVCKSACAFIWLAGSPPTGNLEDVAFHRPALRVAGRFIIPSAVGEDDRRYLAELGYPSELADWIDSIPHSEAGTLDASTARRLGVYGQ